ncbi:MAG: DUF2232 domain-containing protein [Stellaceae bacterium]
MTATSVTGIGVAGIAALCGALAAGPYLLALTDAPSSILLAYLAQVPIFAAGLWRGTGAAALAGTVAILLLLAAGGMLAAGVFAGLNVLPVLLLVRQSLLARAGDDGAIEWYPPGLLTAWLAGLGLVGLIAVLSLAGGPDDIRTELSELLAPVLERSSDGGTPEHGELLGFLSFILPGILAASWMVVTVTNGILAQGMLTRFGNSWRSSPDLAALSLPMWLPMLLAAAAGATLIGGTTQFLGINVIIVLAVPFCLAGLGVLHTVARRFARPAIPLVTFYVLAGVFGWPLLLAALLGVLESSLGIRRRFAQPQSFGGTQ